MERILRTRTLAAAFSLTATAAAIAAGSATTAVAAGTGGVSAPTTDVPAGTPQSTPPPAGQTPADVAPKTPAGGHSGGASYDEGLDRAERTRARRKRAGRPVLASFDASSTALFAQGRPASISYQVNDRSRYVRVRIAFVGEGLERTVYRYDIGRKRTGVLHTLRWRGADGRGLAPKGSYHFRITARDSDGNRLVRSSQSIAAAAQPRAGDHRFPVPGPHDLGGDDALFGAERRGHKHQGQDIAAAEGSPIVAPTAGVVTWREYQADGAGYYLVIGGDNERFNYVFMHLRQGSMLVSKGQRVTAGQQIASVGNTGASRGAHLHFEIWDGPWYNGGHPIDPLPLLRAWDSYS